MSRLPLRRPLAGFTLIELLIVVIIIGILIAIGVPAYLHYVASANDRDAQVALQTAYKAAVAGDTEVNNSRFPVASTIVNDVRADEPAASVARGDCYGTIANAPAKQVLVDPSSTSSQITLCVRSASGTIWRLAGPLTGTPTVSDGSTVPLTTGSSVITDSVRAAAIQGDGLAADSSTGVWESTTNVNVNGGFETATTNWAGWAISQNPVPNLTRDTSTAKFGAASLRVDTLAANPTEGVISTLLPALAGAPFTVSTWVKGTPGQVIQLGMDWKNSGTYLAGSNQLFTLTSGWQRLVFTATSPATTNQITIAVYAHNASSTATTFWLDGVQLEAKPVATPYVDTNTGAASRSGTGAAIQAPASLLTAQQGWYAIRIHTGYSTAALPGTYSGLVGWGPAGTGTPSVELFRSSTSWRMERCTSSCTSAQTVAASWNTGDSFTIIGTWTATQVAVSANGSSFITAANTYIPDLSAVPTFYIGVGQYVNNALGWSDSNILWFACGTGTLTNADAATISGWGDNDPKRASFPAAAQATMVWDGTSSTGSLR